LAKASVGGFFASSLARRPHSQGWSVRFMHDKEVKRYVEEISRLEER